MPISQGVIKHRYPHHAAADKEGEHPVAARSKSSSVCVRPSETRSQSRRLSLPVSQILSACDEIIRLAPALPLIFLGTFPVNGGLHPESHSNADDSWVESHPKDDIRSEYHSNAATC